MTVGQVIDLASTSAKIRTDRIVVAPDAQRITQRAGSPGLLELSEQGIYEVRAAGATSGRPQAIAVNIDPAEADLTSLDPKELVAAVTGHATPDAVETTGPRRDSRGKTTSAGRRSGGICSLPGCCFWPLKRSFPTACPKKRNFCRSGLFGAARC